MESRVYIGEVGFCFVWYAVAHDAHYCTVHDNWLEDGCEDDDCRECGSRPGRPSLLDRPRCDCDYPETDSLLGWLQTHCTGCGRCDCDGDCLFVHHIVDLRTLDEPPPF